VKKFASFLLAITSLASACGSENATPLSESSLSLVERIELHDADSAFIGEVSGFAVLGDSTYVIADRRNGVLHVVDRGGARVRAVGRRGEGPGEWAFGPTLLVDLGNGILAAGDGPFTVGLRTHDWTVAWRIQKSSPSAVPVGARNGDLVYGRVSQESLTLFEQRSPDGELRARFGAVPEIPASNQLVADYFSHPTLRLFGGDSVASAVQSSDYVFFGSAIGGTPDSVLAVPTVRRGAIASELRKATPARTDLAQELMYRPSYPQGLVPIGGSARWGLITVDLSQRSGRMTGALHLTLIDRLAHRTCAELPVPVPDDPLPYVAVRPSELLVATYEDRGDKFVPVIVRFRVSAVACDAS